MEAADGFELEVNVLGLLDAGFNIAGDNRLVVTKLPHIFKDAFMTNPPRCNINTP